MPHFERIQKAFGRYDLHGVRAYTDSAAAAASKALGAEAYATQGKVVFRQARPDLHTVAHEAAHLVQQRQGLRPPGGIGRPGDWYERHADAVADRVVQGGTAERILSTELNGKSTTSLTSMASSTPINSALQLNASIDGNIQSHGAFKNSLKRNGKSDRVSDLKWPSPWPDGTARKFEGRFIQWADGSKPFEKPKNWDKFVSLVGPYADHNLVQGHLLNENLGGPGTQENLTPLTKSANGLHSKKVEEPLKEYVQDDQSRRGQRAHYTVEPEYGGAQQTLIDKIEEERLENEKRRAGLGRKTPEQWVRNYVDQVFPSKLKVRVTWVVGETANSFRESAVQEAAITNEPAG